MDDDEFEGSFDIDVPITWPSNAALFTLWLGFLAISPSYQLAHRSRAGQLSKSDKVQLPADFDDVLRFYDDFGDVNGVEFEDWWIERGLGLCGDIGVDPRVTEVTSLSHNVNSYNNDRRKLIEYMGSDWVLQGMQNTVLVAIPLSLPKGRIAKQVSNIVEAKSRDLKKRTRYKPKYELATRRNNGQTILKYLNVLTIRSALPDVDLWRVGAVSGVSDTYSPELDPDQHLADGEAVYDRMMLTILTSRALMRARMLAENAARGVFPSHKRCEHALHFDLDYVRGLFWPDDD